MSAVTPPLAIAPLAHIDEFVAVEEVQRLAWGLGESALEITPRDTLLAIAHAGGIALGCRDASGTLLGFVYSFLGWDAWGGKERRLRHWSHQMGVVPWARGHGIAERLKLAQRESSLAQGVDLVGWTYDPLQPVNARLNIGRLRAVARRYLRDHYGVMGGINAGLPSDRFEVEWHLNSPRVQQALAGRPAPLEGLPTLLAGRTASGLPSPGTSEPAFDGRPLAFEVPPDFNALKRADAGLALEWRLSSRAWFERAFATGYAAVDAWRVGERAFYALAPFTE